MKKKSEVDSTLILMDKFLENYFQNLLSEFEKVPNKGEHDYMISPPFISFE